MAENVQELYQQAVLPLPERERLELIVLIINDLTRLRTAGGAARSADAVKLSARQVLEAPLPADLGAWAEATSALEAGDVASCARVLAGSHRRLFGWWQARLPSIGS